MAGAFQETPRDAAYKHVLAAKLSGYVEVPFFDGVVGPNGAMVSV